MNLPGMGAATPSLLGYGCMRFPLRPDGTVDEAQAARLIHRVEAVTPELRAMAGGAGSWRGTGGMATKLSAAELAMGAGVDMVITNGARPEDLYGVVNGEDVGTRFVAKPPCSALS